jgi:hypothetical protein
LWRRHLAGDLFDVGDWKTAGKMPRYDSCSIRRAGFVRSKIEFCYAALCLDCAAGSFTRSDAFLRPCRNAQRFATIAADSVPGRR